ncbi:MAG: hypothetical protein CML68_23140 [Rhodobacteraceae bacterium]|nr:hypothetical protein [Paracoccaceae bacterium]
MNARLAYIWRHPVKGIGSEACQTVELTPDGAVDMDRAWALMTDAAADTDAWQPRRNFVQVASGPRLAAVTAQTRGPIIDLSHPDRPPLALDPVTGGPNLATWLGDLWPQDRPTPNRLIRARDHGMTDTNYASVSVGNLASLRALSERAGQDIDMRRFRINLWLDGLAPWAETDLLLHDITLGTARLTPVEPIERCRAPDASPATGARDVSILKLLQDGWDTRNFGINFKVATPGTLSVGDLLQ